MIRDIRVDLDVRWTLRKLEPQASPVVVEVEMEGVRRWLGNLVNFRMDPPRSVLFDFEETSELGVVFSDDLRNGRVKFSAKFEPSSSGIQGATHGDLFLHVDGAMTAIELPTTACSQCPRVFPVMDAYKSTRDDRLICPDCFKAGQAAGTMRERNAEGQGVRNADAAQNPS